MNLADVAPSPTVALGTLACIALAFLFIVSAIALVVILVRRSRRASAAAPDVSSGDVRSDDVP